jgi:hypothetical protein
VNYILVFECMWNSLGLFKGLDSSDRNTNFYRRNRSVTGIRFHGDSLRTYVS